MRFRDRAAARSGRPSNPTPSRIMGVLPGGFTIAGISPQGTCPVSVSPGGMTLAGISPTGSYVAPGPSAGMLLDYDPQYCGVSSGKVTSLGNAAPDYTGQYDLTPPLSGNRPVYTAEDANFNGKPSMGPETSGAQFLACSAAQTDIDQPYTVYVVAMVTVNDSVWRVSQSEVDTYCSAFVGGSGLYVGVNGPDNQVAHGGHISLNTPFVAWMVHNGNSSAVGVGDSTALATGNADSNGYDSGSTYRFILNTRYLNSTSVPGAGYLARYLLYPAVHDATTLAANISALKSLYGIT